MDVIEVFKVSTAILGSVGGAAAIIFGLSTWLGKVWASRILEADRAKYTAQIEILKSDLEKSIHKHNVAVSRIDLQRANAIQKLYLALIVWSEVLLTIRAPNTKLNNDKEHAIKSYQTWAKELNDEAVKFAKLLMHVAIYLHPKTHEIIARCCKSISNLSIEFCDAALSSNESDIEKLFTTISLAIEELNKESDKSFEPAKNALIEEFRKIIDPTIN